MNDSKKLVKISSNKSIYKKMYDIQANIHGTIVKGSTNPHFKSKYASLSDIFDALMPLVSEQRLFITTDISHKSIITTIVDTETSEFLEYVLDFDFSSKPQDFGSLITYYKRYQICSIFGIVPVDADDDGNAANKLLWNIKNVNDATRKLASENTFDVFIARMMGKYAIDDSNVSQLIEYYKSCQKSNE